MPAIRVVMPNGTTGSFPEATPKRVIRQAQADMVAEMKTSPVYEGFDFSQWEPKRKVTVTQNDADDQKPFDIRKGAYNSSPSQVDDPEREEMEKLAQTSPYNLNQDHLRRIEEDNQLERDRRSGKTFKVGDGVYADDWRRQGGWE